MTLKKNVAIGTPQECPACASQTSSIKYTYKTDSYNSSIYHCPACSLLFLHPLPLTQVTERQMDTVDDAEMFHSNILRFLHTQLIVKPEIKKIRHLTGKNTFSVLDIGCGTGWISELWANSGAFVTGLEPSESRAHIARQRNIRVLSCYVEDMPTQERFNLIIIRHVVEHFEQPGVILKNLKKHLLPGGFILVVVPNINCIGRILFDTHWTWVLPWHCSFFTPRSLKILLKKSGYKIKTIYQTPSPLYYPESFIRKYKRLGRFLGNSSLTKLLFSPIALLGWLLGYGDNITIIAQLEEKGKTK